MSKIEHMFIVGAGFSHHAGLPLTSTVTDFLLDTDELKQGGPSSLQAKFLRKFVSEVFSHDLQAEASTWPQLEDVFTCVDLSANTGHHLGPAYSPSDLRTVRRALIVRIIRMLRQAYTRQQRDGGNDWKNLERFFGLVNPNKCAFLSMNWDTVIEEGLKRTQKISSYNYGCDAEAASFDKDSPFITMPLDSTTKIAQIIKPHGSVNWLYCDACRELFWFPPRQTYRIADQLFKKSDWEIAKKSIGEKYTKHGEPRNCPKCTAQALGTRFATFSYRKALDFPMHASSWRTAERLLKQADTWTFIGYSLPGADYEFKHMLKRVELSRPEPPKLVLITGGNDTAVNDTQSNYKKFFGQKLTTVFTNGIEDKSIRGLQKLGSLSPDNPSTTRRPTKR